MPDAVIVSATRTPVGKAPNGSLRTVRPDDLAATVIAEALRRAPGIDGSDIDDVILGCAMPEAEQGLNVARIASLRAGIPVSASAVTVNRFCSSGLQAIAFAAERIMRSFPQAHAITEMLLALNPSALSELRDRGLLAYHLNDVTGALRDLQTYLKLSNVRDMDKDARDEHEQIWEHVKTLRRRVASLN